MAAVSGQGTTYNLPNYHGELFVVSPTETPFLAAIGGLNAAKVTTATQFEWQTVDRRASSANNSALEGAAAPSGSERARTNVDNVVEIHHSAIEVSYTKIAARGQFAGANVAPQWDDLVLDELAVQTMAELESMAVDIEQSFLSGTYQKPSDNTTARKTQGILGAISNVTNAGSAALTADLLNSAIKLAFDNGAKLPQASTVIMVGSAEKVNLTKAYQQSYLNAPVRQNTVGGVTMDTIITDFGTFSVMLNRWMPPKQVAIVDLSVCYPVFLEIPNKGLLFTEELARTGSSRKFQLYGEVGLEYGPPSYHALLSNLAS
ncbi:MAG TPA: DUF5309 family protein [Mycobacteriales bacterium]|nr:DUF5309 family protein [Mycobacteriales bacterium]